jgi:hypothetical protein
MKYISISETNDICFKDDEINIIFDTDKSISDKTYSMFFEQQSMGKQFRIKNIKGTTFEEIFEEYQLINDETNDQQLSETDELKQRIAKLEAMVETLLQEKQNS